MAFATFNGRMQKITQGRIDDFERAYALAYDPMHSVGYSLMVFKDGKHFPASGNVPNLKFLGALDGLVIGIGGCDPSEIPPEQVLPEWEDAAKRFFDPKKNPLTYFQRMMLIKRELIAHQLPIQNIHFMPKYPHHFYPSSEGLFEPSDIAFQYLGVETDHHFHRVQTKGPHERNIVVLYDDYRNASDIVKSNREGSVVTPESVAALDDEEFLLYAKRFRPADDGTTFGRQVEESLEVMFEEGEREGIDTVLSVVCFPRQSDRENAEKRWKRPYHEVMPLKPFDTYMKIKEYLIKQGVDLKRTHIVPLPVDIVLGDSPSRSDYYLPERFVFYSEDLGNANLVIGNKNDKFRAHPNCEGVVYTNE